MLDALTLAALLCVAQADDPPEEPTPEPALNLKYGGTDDERDEGVSLLRYQFTQPHRLDIADGRTKVAVENGGALPMYGTAPVRFFIDNREGPTQTIQLQLSGGQPGARVLREVQVQAGERRTVALNIPIELRYGQARADGPGITSQQPGNVYFAQLYTPRKGVLTLSRTEDFERFVGTSPRHDDANVQVTVLLPDEAPQHLAGYAGFDLVVVPDEATLETAAREALEHYLLTGGHVLVKGPLRDATLFPMADASLADQRYGFGRLFITEKPDASTQYVRLNPPLSPKGETSRYARRYNANDEAARLLPQASAPLGRFLFIITLFTLAIGPGSIFIARRKGPAMLLLTIPATAAVTCAFIIAYSLIADGFTVHVSSHSFTVLDSQRHRAVTVGLNAYYANLGPSKLVLGPGVVPVAPWENHVPDRASADWWWAEGLTVGAGFVPSRTYREWGLLSVQPTRARLVVKRSGDGFVAQNALGFEVTHVRVNVDGALWQGGPVRDGGEVALVKNEVVDTTRWPDNSRFDVNRSALLHDVPPGAFVAHAKGGAGFVPQAGLTPEFQANGEHWVRGEFEP